MLTYLPELVPCIEAEWQSHIADDFRWLSTIPSGYVAAHCELFRSNPSKYGASFLLRHSTWALSPEEKSALWAEYLKEAGENLFRYKAVAEWKPGVKYQLDNGEWSLEERERLKAFWLQLADVDTPKATEIRKALQPILSREFDTKLVSQGGGVWTAPILLNGLPLSIVFDFGGFSRGFCYELWLPLELEGSRRASLSYEYALGFNLPAWNLLRTNALPEQLEVVAQTIKKILAWLALVNWDTKKLDIL